MSPVLKGSCGTTRPACCSAPAASPSSPRPAAPPASPKPLVVTDKGPRARRHHQARGRHPGRRRHAARPLRRGEGQPDRRERRGRPRGSAPAATTASSPPAAARASTSARPSPSWPARRGRYGTSRTSATGGHEADPAGIRADRRRADHRRHRLGGRPRLGRSPTRRRTRRRSSSIRRCSREDRRRRSGAHHRPAAEGHGVDRSSTPSPTASRRCRRRASARWPTASRSKGCGSSRPTCRRAAADGTDIEARAAMLAAAAMGATAFQRRASARCTRSRTRSSPTSTPTTASPTR